MIKEKILLAYEEMAEKYNELMTSLSRQQKF